MTAWDFSVFKSFRGVLSKGNDSCDVEFRVRLDAKGEVELNLDEIPVVDRTTFILREFNSKGPGFSKFILSGSGSDDFACFETADLYVTGIRTGSSTSRSAFLTARCSTCRMSYRSSENFVAPALIVSLKGFFNFGRLVAETDLGSIEAAGQLETSAPDQITGRIALAAKNAPADIADWREKGGDLIEHVRRIMSFSSACILRAPVRAFYFGDTVEVTCFSQVEQRSPSTRVFHHMDQGPIFRAAVRSFFQPKLNVQNLFFAIEWFAMEASYNEARLVNAMTALEMLVESNLDEADTKIQAPAKFKKIRKALKATIQTCIDEQGSDDAESVAFEINEKLDELNRRSFYRKLVLLAQQWNVPLAGLDEATIKAAIGARNLVVHRGQYYGQLERADDLWHHVTVVRELVVRFLLRALGFKGRYFSHIGGTDEHDFPPEIDTD